MKVLAVIVLAVLAGGSALDLDLAGEIRGDLEKYLGPVGDLSVRVEWSSRARLVSGQLDAVTIRLDGVDAERIPLTAFLPQPRRRTLKGRVQRVELEATQVQLRGLRVSRLHLDVTDLRYDLVHLFARKEFAVTGAGRADVEVDLIPREVAHYVARKLPTLKNPEVAFHPDRVVLTGRLALGLFEAPLELEAKLRLVQGQEIHLADVRLALTNLTLPEPLVKSMTQKLNPLLRIQDLTASPLPLVLDELELREGELRLRGRLRGN